MSPFSHAISWPPRVLTTSVSTTAPAAGRSTSPKVDVSSARPKLRKKNAAKTSRNGRANCSMRARIPGRAQHEPDQEGADRIRDAEQLADAAERDRQAEEQDREQLVVAGAARAARRPARPSARSRTSRSGTGTTIAELEHDRPDIGLAADHDRDDRQVDRDEDVLDAP